LESTALISTTQLGQELRSCLQELMLKLLETMDSLHQQINKFCIFNALSSYYSTLPYFLGHPINDNEKYTFALIESITLNQFSPKITEVKQH